MIAEATVADVAQTLHSGLLRLQGGSYAHAPGLPS